MSLVASNDLESGVNTMPMTARQKNAFLTAPPKQDVVSRALDVTTELETTSLMTTSDPGKARHWLHRTRWAPVVHLARLESLHVN